MARWFDLVAASMVWVGRFYGVVFMALSGLFLHWGTRGFLALRHGTHESWSDPVACAIALVIAGLSLLAGYHLVTNPDLARRYAGGSNPSSRSGARSKWKRGVKVVLVVGLGVFLLIDDNRVLGVAILLWGLTYLALTWRFRHSAPLDPQLEAAVDAAMPLEDRDPAAADQILIRAVEGAAQREEQQLAELRSKATHDRRAALELRNRLRGKLELAEAARRRAEKVLANKPDGATGLAALAREVDNTRQQLVEAEQLVERLRGT